jgi:predicted NAD/FAD-binding protein
MVYNSVNYPNLCAFFEEISIKGIDTTMGFSVSIDNGKFEWCSDSLQGLLANPSNLVNKDFYLMFKDIFRFNVEAAKLLTLEEGNPIRSKTVGQFLVEKNFSDAFRDFYLIPMTAAIWSATGEDVLSFPAITLFTFLNKYAVD